MTAIEAQLSELDAIIEADRTALRRQWAEARSLEVNESARTFARTRRDEVAEHEAGLNETIAARAQLAEERAAHLVTLSRPLAPEAPEAHISNPHEPLAEGQDQRTRLLKLWAKVSIPLLLGCIVVALTASPLALVTTVLVLVIAFTGVEALARRRFVSFMLATLLLVGWAAGSIALVLLFLAHWRVAVSVVIGVAALVLLVGNLLRG